MTFHYDSDGNWSYLPPPPIIVTVRPDPRREFLRGYRTGAIVGLAFSLFFTLVLLMLPSRRTNILLLGLDRRPDEETFVSRTDTMILMTVNPRRGYVGMLSIPRDLYVTLPDGDLGRINTAHFFAEAQQPGAGPQAAAQTVRSNFGVDVHHFVRMDLVGFARLVDAAGGIVVDVPKPLIDYEYPTYDYGTTVVEFQAGRQHMNGEQALAYARIRHGSSDFQRAERQQVVIQAFFARLLQPGAWVRAPLLIVAINQAIDTDLNFFQLLRLAPTLLRAGPARLDRRVIEGSMVRSYTTENGGAVQLPVWENISPVLREMFGN